MLPSTEKKVRKEENSIAFFFSLKAVILSVNIAAFFFLGTACSIFLNLSIIVEKIHVQKAFSTQERKDLFSMGKDRQLSGVA